MVAPGSLDARFSTLDETTKTEWYWVRRRLRFSIDEWRALPWWQRRVYLEGLHNEAEEQEQASEGGGSQPTGTGLTGVDAILFGTAEDVRGSGFGT